MGANSKIEWTTHTFNPWQGCTKVHTGCQHCYAESLSKRTGKVVWGPNGTRVKTSEANWKLPLKWDREAKAAGERNRVFCASLADVFEDWAGPIHDHQGDLLGFSDGKWCKIVDPRTPYRATLNDLRRELFQLIDATPNLDWLLLTKRPENARRMIPDYSYHACVTGDCPHDLQSECDSASDRKWRENVWLGTSVSDQETADKAIPELLKCRDLAPVLFLSIEPLVGPVNLTIREGAHQFNTLNGYLYGPKTNDPRWTPGKHPHIDWAIVGGESGHGARVCNVRWIRSIRDQCKSAGVPVFIKQLGARPIEGGDFAVKTGPVASWVVRDKKGGDWDEWPEDLRVREFPQEAAHA